jgi:hypothetical protein
LFPMGSSPLATIAKYSWVIRSSRFINRPCAWNRFCVGPAYRRKEPASLAGRVRLPLVPTAIGRRVLHGVHSLITRDPAHDA